MRFALVFYKSLYPGSHHLLRPLRGSQILCDLSLTSSPRVVIPNFPFLSITVSSLGMCSFRFGLLIVELEMESSVNVPDFFRRPLGADYPKELHDKLKRTYHCTICIDDNNDYIPATLKIRLDSQQPWLDVQIDKTHVVFPATRTEMKLVIRGTSREYDAFIQARQEYATEGKKDYQACFFELSPSAAPVFAGPFWELNHDQSARWSKLQAIEWTGKKVYIWTAFPNSHLDAYRNVQTHMFNLVQLVRKNIRTNGKPRSFWYAEQNPLAEGEKAPRRPMMPWLFDRDGQYHVWDTSVDFYLDDQDMPNVNEPILRVGTRNSWTPSLFSENIGTSLANVEAALIQVVGTRAEVACTHCQEIKGPFAHCVRIAGDQNHCGNCHWGGNRDRCSFNAAPATPAPIRVRRRKMTDEQYRAYQQKIRDLREQKGYLVGLRKERQKSLLDCGGHHAAAIASITSYPIQPHVNSTNIADATACLVSIEIKILETDNLLDGMVDDLFALVDEIL